MQNTNFGKSVQNQLGENKTAIIKKITAVEIYKKRPRIV